MDCIKEKHKTYMMLAIMLFLSSVIYAQIDCGIMFYHALPAPGTMGVPVDHDIMMSFGPTDPACTTFCIDTASFEGVISFGVPGAVFDTIYLSHADVSFAPADFGQIRITYEAPFDWPFATNIRAFFAVSDCWGHRVHGVTEFSIAADTTVPPDCLPVFVSSNPSFMESGVWWEHSMSMIFGPLDTLCDSVCWDTTSFHGWIRIYHDGLADTVAIDSDDVEFWFGDAPNIGIEYNFPGGWPGGAIIEGEWRIEDCSGHYADKTIRFYTVDETECFIMVDSMIPHIGSIVPVDAPITMFFMPANSACSTLCIDTTSFEGEISIWGPGTTTDTIYLASADVEFMPGEFGRIPVTYDPPFDWPADALVNASFELYDCYSHEASLTTLFRTVADTTVPPDCGIMFYHALPAPGTMGVPVDHDIMMSFGPTDPACTTFCIDTASFEGVISFGVPGAVFDTIYLSHADVSFAPADFGQIRITYEAPFDWPFATNIRAFFAVSDCWGHRVHGITEFSIVADTTVPPDTFVVHFITPVDSAYVACTYQQIKFRIEPFVPESLIVYVNWGFYTLGASPELTVSGDTVTFTPTMPWSESPVVAEVMGARLFFWIDLSNPVMFPVFPSDLSTVPLDPGPTIVARYHIHDSRSGLAHESVSITVMVDGVLRGTYGIGHPGVSLVVEEVYFDFGAAGITLAHGDSVMMIISAADRAWRDFCGPNLRVENLRFVVGDPAEDLHHIRGRIVEAGTGIPVAGAQVQLFDYLGGPISGLTSATGIDGFYSFTVFPGTYSLGAFDSTSHYMPVFYYERPGLLEADPIFITTASPDTIILTTMHMFPSAPMLCTITGSVLAEADGPIDAAYVVAISSEEDEIQDAALTGPSGNYGLNVPLGEYYVLAFHSSYIPSFYDGTLEWGSATVVNVTADVSGIDLELIPTLGSGDRMIWGYVYSEGESRSAVPLNVRGVRVYVLDVEDDRPVAFGISDYEGRYSIDDIGEGTYKVFGDYCGFTPDIDFVQVELTGWENRLDIEMVPTTGVGEKPAFANTFELASVYPNPFNSTCAIGFKLGGSAEVRIEVLDLTGRIVEVVENRAFTAGSYVCVWSPGDLSSGAYLVRMSAGGKVSGVKALFIK